MRRTAEHSHRSGPIGRLANRHSQVPQQGCAWFLRICVSLVCGVVVLISCSIAHAQSGSLLSRVDPGQMPTEAPESLPSAAERLPANTLGQCSWTHMAVEPPEEIKIHDIVSVRVDILARVQADGRLQRKRDSTYDAKLKDWIVFKGLRAVGPAPQTDGDQRVQGELRSQYRSEGDLETSESLAFNLAAEIVDIRPNGNLVLEGHANVVLNDEHWSYVLRGTCSPDAIGPNRVVLSRDIVGLSIRKDETGSVAAGYQRGWFQKIFDMIQPF